MGSFARMEERIAKKNGDMNRAGVGSPRVTRIMSDGDVSAEHLRSRLQPPQRDRRGSLYSIREICGRVHKLAGSTLALPGWVV